MLQRHLGELSGNADPRLLPNLCKSDWGRDVSKLYDQNLQKVDCGCSCQLGEEEGWSGEDPSPLFCLKHSWHHLSWILISLHLLSPRIMPASISYALFVRAELLAKSSDPCLGCIPNSDINSASGLEVESPDLAKF